MSESGNSLFIGRDNSVTAATLLVVTCLALATSSEASSATPGPVDPTYCDAPGKVAAAMNQLGAVQPGSRLPHLTGRDSLLELEPGATKFRCSTDGEKVLATKTKRIVSGISRAAIFGGNKGAKTIACYRSGGIACFEIGGRNTGLVNRVVLHPNGSRGRVDLSSKNLQKTTSKVIKVMDGYPFIAYKGPKNDRYPSEGTQDHVAWAIPTF